MELFQATDFCVFLPTSASNPQCYFSNEVTKLTNFEMGEIKTLPSFLSPQN